jgi:hypothetical protein
MEDFFFSYSMALDIHEGGRILKEHCFGIFQYSGVRFFAMRLYFRQQHDTKAYLREIC